MVPVDKYLDNRNIEWMMRPVICKKFVLRDDVEIKLVGALIDWLTKPREDRLRPLNNIAETEAKSIIDCYLDAGSSEFTLPMTILL